MLQRVQTLFLLGSVIAMVLLFFFPMATVEAGNSLYELSILGLEVVKGEEAPEFSVIPLVILNALILIFTGIMIFSYKNRVNQLKLGKLIILFLVGFIVLAFYYVDQAIKLEALEDAQTHYQPAIAFPVLALIFTIMANRFVKKDEDLVRSADRLR